MRVSAAGCFDRCSGGPVAVVYPEGAWYSYVDLDDVDEIVQAHLLGGQVVARLLLAPEVGRRAPQSPRQGLTAAATKTGP